MMPTRGAASTALGILLLMAAWACAGPVRGADTVVYASGADLESANPLVTIHPLARQVQRYVLLVTLARYDERLDPEPYAARSWSWSNDRRELTLDLVESLRWHDGTPTTAEDVVFTVQAARDPATGYPRHADLGAISEAVTDGPYRVVLRFDAPQTAFPQVLAELPIAPAHLLREVPRERMRQAEFGRRPVGNGPFRFVGRTPGQRWIFERDTTFPAELGGPPHVRRLVIAVVDEATTKFAGLVAGSLDVAGIAPTMAHMVHRDARLRVLDYPVLFSTALIFNVHRPPLDDARVRRALSLAVDRERIVDAALAGFGTPAVGPVPPDHPFAAAPTAPRDADPDSLLDAAGWPRDAGGWRARGGRRMVLEMLTVGGADAAAEQLLQADLARLGIRLEIRQRELAAFLAEARAAERRWDVLYTGIPGDLSLAYLAALYESRLAGGALDYAGYHTPRLDALFAAARRASPDDATAIWRDVQHELDVATPAAWIYHARGVQGLTTSLQGVEMDLRGELVSISRWTRRPDVQRTSSR